jgi:hypothetical protein
MNHSECGVKSGLEGGLGAGDGVAARGLGGTTATIARLCLQQSC